MTLLAVMTRCRVTQGAVSRVPISGALMGYLTGQLTLAGSLSTGAARSEPHMVPGTGRACRAPCVHRYGGGCVPGGVPRVQGVPGTVQGARTTPVSTSAYVECP